MCQIHASESASSSGTETTRDDSNGNTLKNQNDNVAKEKFPWHIGIYDAHCHPTDSMDIISSLPNMRARVLTIMATRSNDQDLVAKTASNYNYTHPSSEADQPPTQKGNIQTRALASYGYHPWFSHLIYDDLSTSSKTHPDKQTHYNAILISTPAEAKLISNLPTPRPLSQIISETKKNLLAHPHALVGEVGLDRAFRIPLGEPDPQRRHPLSKHRVKPAHQIRILQAQLRLAGELGRAASVHVVGGQGAAFEALRELWRGHEIHVPSARERKMLWRKAGDPVVDEDAIAAADGDNDVEHAAAVEEETKPSTTDEATAATNSTSPDPKPFPPRICLHSFSGAPETIQQYLHASIPVRFYFSFSEVINFSTANEGEQGDGSAAVRAMAAMKLVPEDRLLIESDMNVCGPVMDDMLEKVVRRVCTARGWELEDGVTRLRRNWMGFVFGE